jgi:hypothetical protein
MKHFSLFCALTIVFFVLGCGNQAPTDAALSESQSENSSNETIDNALAKSGKNFVAHLSGDEEVPAVSTLAQGQAIVKLSSDGSSMSYKLIVANIQDVLMSHIHLAPAGVNGPVVVWLYPSGPPPVLIPGRFQGVLAEGTITAANLVGPLAGAPLSALLDAMKNGDTYVNVHTPANPGGEVRGQIQ